MFFHKKFKNVKNLIKINKNLFENTAENVVYFVEIIGFVKEVGDRFYIWCNRLLFFA